jgi:translation initiation factor IF-3
VRLIGSDGSQLGIKPLPEALSLARELELDLVEVADKASPPVVRIMDYGKFKYEAAQKAKESRRKTTNVSVKEMKYRPKIGGGDFDTKTRKVEQFLTEGHKVKITIMFRGREMQHPELGKKILDEVAEQVSSVGKVEAWPRLDGRNMTMVMAPDKGGKPAPRPRPPAPSLEQATNNTDPAPASPVVETAAPPETVVDTPAPPEPAADQETTAATDTSGESAS